LSAVSSECSASFGSEVDEKGSLLTVFNVLYIEIRNQSWVETILNGEVVLKWLLQGLIGDVGSN